MSDKDTMFIAHNLHLGQKLGAEPFQSLRDEVSRKGYEILLVETIVRGESLVDYSGGYWSKVVPILWKLGIPTTEEEEHYG